MAASIIWGLAFSTMLTLFVVPVLYRIFMRERTVESRRRFRVNPA